MPYLSFVLICAVWSSSFILMKRATVCFSPAAVGFGRVLGGALVLAVLWWFRSHRNTLRRQDLGVLALVVACGFVWPYALQPYLVARNGSAFVGMTIGFTPMLTIVASIPLLGLVPTARQFLGVSGALVCLGMLMVDAWHRETPVPDMALAVSVPLGYAIANTMIRRSLRHVSPLELTFISLTAAGVLLLPVACLTATPTTATRADLPAAVACLAILGVVGTGLAMYLFNKLIHEQGPLFAGMVTNLSPVGALLWGWVDRERVTPLQVFALIGLVAMVTIVQFGAAVAPLQVARDPAE